MTETQPGANLAMTDVEEGLLRVIPDIDDTTWERRLLGWAFFMCVQALFEPFRCDRAAPIRTRIVAERPPVEYRRQWIIYELSDN